MNDWTQSAKDLMADHLARLRRSMDACGADPEEVSADLRRHVEEELAREKLSSITANDVKRVLARLGEPEDFGLGAARDNPAVGVASEAAQEEPNVRRKRYPFSLVFGSILPLVTLAIELATHMCAGVFFDPIPTWWHAVLVAGVSLANSALWWHVVCRGPERVTWAWMAGGYALMIGLAYTLWFLPLTLPGLLGLIVFGFGLLPLTPLLCLVSTARLLWAAMGTPRACLSKDRSLGLVSGAGTGLVMLLLVNAPNALTHLWMRQAAEAQTIEDARGALKWLRRVGDEEAVLRACYATNVRGTHGIDSWDWNVLGKPASPEAAQQVYFQVTGRAFNEAPPPQAAYGSARWDYLDDWVWDESQGGQTVARRIKGLSLRQSRLDGWMDAQAGWAYMEWILEFKNEGPLDREARAQLALPPGGVVSRLTLWVNGEEREAAFAGTAQTRAAYQEVAVRQMRDPVLVTSAGNDRVLMQCFPVPRAGGTIKVRLGITAPWVLESELGAALRLPCILERNFEIRPGESHSIWMESKQPLEGARAGLKQDQSKPGAWAWRGEVSDADLGGVNGVLRAQRVSGGTAAWVKDNQGTNADYVLQAAKLTPPLAVSRLVLVLDGALDMEDFFDDVAEALDRVPEGIEVAAVLAQDGVDVIWPPRKWSKEIASQLAATIRQLRGIGGQDNQAALLHGWELAAEVPEGLVVWIHGPQPVLLDRLESFKQRLLWRPDRASRLFELQTRPGPNRLAEAPETALLLSPVPRLASVKDDLRRLFSSLGAAGKAWAFTRWRATVAPASAADEMSSRHLARLWAQDEVWRLMGAKRTDEAVKTAARYHLVTPVSGAVVLETKEQFARAGLEAVSAESVPTVPEPGTWVLIGLGMIGGLVLLRWKARSVTEVISDR